MLVEHPVDITIIIPMYNCEDYISMAVQSVFDQDFSGNVELIAVNDGSVDGTAEIVTEMARREPRMLVRLLSQENRGVAAARNAGLRYAAGEYIAFLDADDQLLPNFCSSMFELACNDDADLVICSRKQIHSNEDMRGLPSENPIQEFGYSRCKAPFSQDFLASLFWEKELGTAVWNKLYRKTLIGTFSSLQYYEDYPFNLEYITKCSTISVISDEIYCHRVGTGKAIRDSEYAECGWEAKVVESQLLKNFVILTSGKPLSKKNSVLASDKLLRDAQNAIAHGLNESVVFNSNIYRDALETRKRTSC